MTFDEWWINQAESEESDDLDYLNLRQQVILAGWVKKSWNAAKADAAQEVERLRKRYEQSTQRMAELREYSELLYKALKAIKEFHGHCWCGECDECETFVCVEIQEIIDAYSGLLAAQPGEQSDAR